MAQALAWHGQLCGHLARAVLPDAYGSKLHCEVHEASSESPRPLSEALAAEAIAKALELAINGSKLHRMSGFSGNCAQGMV